MLLQNNECMRLVTSMLLRYKLFAFRIDVFDWKGKIFDTQPKFYYLQQITKLSDYFDAPSISSYGKFT